MYMFCLLLFGLDVCFVFVSFCWCFNFNVWCVFVVGVCFCMCCLSKMFLAYCHMLSRTVFYFIVFVNDIGHIVFAFACCFISMLESVVVCCMCM